MDIVLASQSPRRKEILSQYLDFFHVQASDFDESTIGETVPHVFASEAARLKALELSASRPSALIIAGDTIVVDGDRILGKPKSHEEAFATLKSLSGKAHQVISGLCLLYKEKSICLVEHEITDIIFNDLSDKVIEEYLDKKTYLDKAGSYAIQDIGEIFVKKIDGDYNNVVGFPLELFKRMYGEFKSLLNQEEV